LPSGFISSGCSAKTFRILNSFATAVDCNAAFTTKGISLDQIVNVAALDPAALLVFELLLNKPIQVPAPTGVSSISEHHAQTKRLTDSATSVQS
jgi:hypothetical protein